MAASLSSPGSSSSSSFDPYSEDMAHTPNNPSSSLDINSGRKSPEKSQGLAVGDKPGDASSIHSTDKLYLTHRPTRAFPSEHPGQRAFADREQQRKRKRNAAGVNRPENYQRELPNAPDEPKNGLVMESQSGSPSSSWDTKRVKIADDKKLPFPVATNPSRPGIPMDKPQLPLELWQHIFTFLPPVSLGRVLQVNRAFNTLLVPGQAELPLKRAILGSFSPVNPNSIWSASRKTFHSGLPRPLFSATELDTWKLVLGVGCQFCDNCGPVSDSSDSPPWEKGPGEAGIQIVWPFGVRSCAACLKRNCYTEMDLLFSSTLPSLLLPALPFAFFTPSMHYASSILLRASQPPTGLVLSKYFLKSQVEEIKSRFEEVKALGSAAAEEWVKGLEGNGKERMADAARWEQWETGSGLRHLKSNVSQLGLLTEITARSEQNQALSREPSSSNHHVAANEKISSRRMSPSAASNNHGPKNISRPISSGLQAGYPPPASNASHHRGERNIRQVNEAKASRKAEIERRCAELNPPLMPSVLSHMESFIAAIQIPHPFTVRDWDILKPRLLAQREVAERREKERKMQDVLLQEKKEERRQQEAQLKEAKDLVDKEWEEVQKPIKDRMALYADEIIREGWRGGVGVTKEKCPKFAADVLMYVRNKFYDDRAKEDAKARNEGIKIEEDSASGPPHRKLILENMKFVFDTKIKPLTEQFQKELFLCNGCENNAKFYGFEGVIQHYAAKHTNVLSLGSIVVHWRTEWPERPPFHPDPNAAKALLYAMPRASVSHGYHTGAPESVGYPQPSPGPYSRTPYGTPYAYGSGPYRPPSPQYFPGQNGYGYPPPQPGYPPSGPYDQHVPPPPNAPYGSPFPGQAYPPPYSGSESRNQHHPSYQAPYGGQAPTGPYMPPYPRQGPPAGSHKPNQSSQSFGLYQTHLDDIAKNARNIWNSTSGIKDLPHTVRAHVVIHHVTTRFIDRFRQEPALALFSDGLNCHPQMKPIRNLSGLVCKACSDAQGSRRFRPHDTGKGDRKMYTLPALISHFQSVHVDSTRPQSAFPSRDDTGQPDWKVHMLALPDNNILASLAQAPGMDQVKFQLITTAFPWVFSPTPAAAMEVKRPLPEDPTKVDSRQGKAGVPKNMDKGRDKKPRLSSPNRVLEVPAKRFSKFVDRPKVDNTNLHKSTKDEEYDPHKPGFVEPAPDAFGQPGSRPPPGKPGTPISRAPDADRRTKGLHPDQRRSTHIHPMEHKAKERPTVHGDLPPRYLPSGKPIQLQSRPSQVRLDEMEPGNNGGTYSSARVESRHVSEDGEVSEPHRGPDIKKEALSSAEEMNAAERFLSSFDPGQEQDDYKPGPKGVENPQSELRGEWLEPVEPDGRNWRTDVIPGPGAEPTAPRNPNVGWPGRTRSPAFARGYRGFDPNHEAFEPSNVPMSRRGEVISPDSADPRAGRRTMMVSDPKHQPAQSQQRPQSRFDRYEAQRQGSFRPRSRSPHPSDRIPMEPAYYRDRSPQARGGRAHPGFTTQASEAYQIPSDHSKFARMPTQGQYRYVEDYAESPYDGAVEYVPVRVSAREPQAPGAYYLERPVHRAMPADYGDYELEYARQPIVEEPHGQYYPPVTGARNIPDMAPSTARGARYR